MLHTENSNDMIPFKRLTTTWNYKCSLNEHSIHFTIRHLVRNTSEAHVLEISTMSKRHPEADHDSFLTKYGCESLHVAQRWEKHFGSKKPPNGITPPPPHPMQTVKVQLCGSPTQTSTDVQWFLLQVRGRTEANQLTVNKWSPSFYWAGERKRECRSASCGRYTRTYIHTHKHTHKHKWWLMYYMPLKSNEERTDRSQVYKKSLQFQISRQIYEGL